MFCKKCGTKINDTARFCPGCGASIERRPAPGGRAVCPKCGAFVKENANFCKRCGARITAPTAQSDIQYCYCGAPINAGARFCRKCGAPVMASASKPVISHCSCGAELKPGAKFCRKCGAPKGGDQQVLNIPAPPGATVTVTDGSDVWVCPECGMALPSKKAFCPECSLRAVAMRQYLEGWVCPECRQRLEPMEKCPDCNALAVQRMSLTAGKSNDRQPRQAVRRAPDQLKQKVGNAARQAAGAVVPKVKAVIPKVKAIIPKVKAFIPTAKTTGKGALEIETPAASTAGEMRVALDSEQMNVLSSVARSLMRR